MAKKKKPLELFVDGMGDQWRIVNQDGETVTIEQARKMWEAGEVTNFNHSFRRLATRAGWDFAELSRQYAVEDRVRGLLKS